MRCPSHFDIHPHYPQTTNARTSTVRFLGEGVSQPCDVQASGGKVRWQHALLKQPLLLDLLLSGVAAQQNSRRSKCQLCSQIFSDSFCLGNIKPDTHSLSKPLVKQKKLRKIATGLDNPTKYWNNEFQTNFFVCLWTFVSMVWHAWLTIYVGREFIIWHKID